MAYIRSLKPNVSREEAIQQFSAGGPLDYLRQTAFGPLRSVAEFYIPFRLFQVEILNRGKPGHRIFGLDAVTGSLDLYEFEELPGPENIVCLETRNHAEPLLEEVRATALLITKVQRLLFTAGFFRMQNLQISARPVPGEIHIPYWVAFCGRGRHARFEVLDAVRRRREGAKVRNLLRNWLTAVREQPC